MQQIEFPGFPKVDGSKYVDTLLLMVRHLKSTTPNEKQFRRWLRGNGWYDKATYGDMMDFIGVSFTAEGPVLKGLSKKLMDMKLLDDVEDTVFDFIAGRNEILAKYVFDAVAERLYSTSELYRMLTSYVYPGKPIDLPMFTTWLYWIQGTKRMRVLGIRWALGKRYDESKKYLATIDVDEILEEEAEEALLDEAPPEEEEEGAVLAAAPAAAPAPKPQPAAPTAAEANVGWEPPEDDTPPSAVAAAAPTSVAPAAPAAVGVDMAALAALLQANAAKPPELIEARLLKPADNLPLLAADASLERVKAAMEASPRQDGWWESLTLADDALAHNLEKLMSWWSNQNERPSLRADRFGIMPFGEVGWQEGTKAKFLFRLACLSLSVIGDKDLGVHVDRGASVVLRPVNT